jgi:hypothetical protein
MDEPESLTCPVIVKATDWRAILAVVYAAKVIADALPKQPFNLEFYGHREELLALRRALASQAEGGTK